MRNIVFLLKYGFLQILRDKQFLFWMGLFPILLVSVFYLAFSNIDSGNFTVVFGVEADSALMPVLEKIEVFDLLIEDDEAAFKNKLLDGGIDAYINSDYEVVVANSSSKSNVAVDVIGQIRKYSLAYIFSTREERVIPLSDEEILALKLKDIVPYMSEGGHFSVAGLEEKISSTIRKETQETSVLQIVLFTAVAMFSFYGAFTSTRFTSLFQGYLSRVGARISVSSFKKSELVLSTIISAAIMSILFVSLVIGYINLILGVKIFTDATYTLLILLVACFFSIAMGTAIGIIKGIKYEYKGSVINGILLLSSFLCGMGGDASFKTRLDDISPIINLLNPVNLVNESLYQVNLIGNTANVFRNLSILLVAGSLIFVIVGVFLRRKSYDSI